MNKLLRGIAIFIFILLTSWAGYSQGSQNQQEEVTARYLQLSQQLVQTSIDSSLLFAIKADSIAVSANSKELQVKTKFQLGFVYYSQNNFDRAIQLFNESVNLARNVKNPNDEALALNRLGNSYQLKTSYLTALEYYTKALEINKTSNNQAEVARTLVNLANVYSIIGQYQRSIEHFLEAMSIHESIGEREGLAWASLGIARLFKRLDLNEKAMQYAESALVYYREIEHQTGMSVGVTLCLNEIGSIYHKMGNFDKALDYNRMVIEINERNGNVHGQASNYLSLGIIYLEKENVDFAYENLIKSLRLKEEVGDSLDLSLLYRKLGEVEEMKGNYRQSLGYLNKSLSFAQHHRLTPDVSEAFMVLSSVYNKMGMYRDALNAYANYSAYKDSLNSSEISRLEMQYEFEKREKEQELLARQREAIQEVKLDRQRSVLLFFVVAFVLVGVLAGMIYRSYKQKKKTNQLLIEQNNEISRQKLEIENQKDEIEQQRDYVTKQRDQIAEQQRLITDSILYASRIQNAVLPSDNRISLLPWESFVFYRPKNIVSGDFYWISNLSNGKILLASADCTGHGVPGAFMSMLGITLLREITSKPEVPSPAEILAELRKMVILSLNQQTGHVDQADGMDMAITVIDPVTLSMEFAGAYLSAIVVRRRSDSTNEVTQNPRVYSSNGLSLIEFRGKKMPIGYHVLGESSFENHTFQLQKDDTLYLFSDGYVDQFGGERNTKFLMQSFRELLFSINAHSLASQKQKIEETITTYQGERKQVDDMLVLGVRFS
ncbi:MAG TPA: tetratricopeptide repeat protein [Tenuifilaceae bacterium]|nr:tetratricopeptide repeat protein [Tenuifilaceae bacterium]HPE17063.1 tetratricopeptide repeat protein [Tenuifilaceae bacterium]HPJ44652.1 tetratricopeptide repeat protein [Tenuifilaceae bacterium]HPQ32915.1 tetratricopeptide repeat protein [Tenuifilaceae bacterium]HRX66733.1 tetratricopeptide repeat protein [Tenuifilaceae bacterium]